MATQFQFRRGTNTQRLATTFALGEGFYTTDTKLWYMGDGTTVGGNLIGPVTAGGNNSGSTHVAGVRPTLSAAGNTNVSPGSKISPYTAAFNVTAGIGLFTANLVLIGSAANQGDLIHVSLLLPPATNPTVVILDSTLGGTVLDTVTCDGSGQDWLGVYVYNGSAWEKLRSAFQI